MSDEQPNELPAVLLQSDLAKLLRCSLRTIQSRLAHAPHLLPPQMSRVDRRPRWYEPTVRAWMAEPARTAPTFGRKRGGFR
jgi:hypothetical protein